MTEMKAERTTTATLNWGFVVRMKKYYNAKK